VYSEEVISSKNLDSDVAMFDGAKSWKIWPNIDEPWCTYRRAVEQFTVRTLSYERDVLNAFAGFLNNMSHERCLEGLPVSTFDLALLWQPRECLRRRTEFSSWSWAGWVGGVQWFDDQCLDGCGKQFTTEKQRVDDWIKKRCWIVWHCSRGTNSKSPAFLIDGPPCIRESRSKAVTIDLGSSEHPTTIAPTPSLMSQRIEGLDQWRLDARYLQFWTMSAHFDIELDTSAVLNYTSYVSEHTGNSLRRFLLRDKDKQDCGWVILDQSWIELITVQDTRRQEFIMLSEVRVRRLEKNHRSDGMATDGTDEADSIELNALMIDWYGGIAKRVGLGRVRKDALQNSCGSTMTWKEILLG
jgi:hypothetical protein